MQAGAQKPTQRRASSRRSRVGCSTCKRRRVKCDEDYPHCLRCRKANLKCGYSQTTLTPSSRNMSSLAAACGGRNTKRIIILPKLHSCSDAVTLSTVRPSAILPNETEVENRYLRYFHQETSAGFQSTWDWTLWNRIVLQGCHHEPFMRYAVVAIGALHKSLRSSSPKGHDSSNTMNASESMAKLHREFAYLSYGKALKMMQAVIDADPSPRDALIACLLVVCFESHTGNRYKALSHAKYGLQILQESGNHDRLRRKVEDQSSVVSTLPTTIDKEIIDAFRNLDIQISTVSDSRTVDLHEKLMEEDAGIMKLIPNEFKGLDEAKSFWSVILRRSCHFMGSTWRRTEPENLTREFETKVPGSILVTVGDTIHTTSFKVDETVRIGERRFSEEIAHWLEAFQPIFLRIRRTTDSSTSRDYVIATMLQIQALVAKIAVAGVGFTQEILYDQFHQEFKDIIRHAKEISEIRYINSVDFDYWSGIFLLDLGLVAPLFIVLLRCRDPVLRRKAIEILNTWHVECWWDPLLVVAVGRFIIKVEEAGMENGFIPESARAILTAKSHCPPQRVLQVQCVQRTGRLGGELKWTEGFVTW